MNKIKIQKIIMEIYRQMYKEASPSADIDEIINSGEGKKSNWFDKYYLSSERQIAIIFDFCKKNKLTNYEKDIISMEVLLGSAPSCIKPKIYSRCLNCGRFIKKGKRTSVKKCKYC